MHLAYEVQDYGSLDPCSAFSFENYIQELKRLVRSGKNLVQIAKRLSESYGAIPHVQETVISLSVNKKPDNCFTLTDSSCCEVLDKSNHPDDGENKYFCHAQVYKRTEAVLHRPCDSCLIGLHKGNPRWTTMKVVSAQSLTRNAINHKS